MKTRSALLIGFCLAFVALGASAQQAPKFPTKPVRLMVPYAPGGH